MKLKVLHTLISVAGSSSKQFEYSKWLFIVSQSDSFFLGRIGSYFRIHVIVHIVISYSFRYTFSCSDSVL